MSAQQVANLSWSYDDPSEWLKHFSSANGLCQSPINVILADTIEENFSPLHFSSAYQSNHKFLLTNQGCQIIATLVGDPNNTSDLYCTGAGLTGKYHFVNFHLHWGDNNQHGSDHQIDGHSYPAEVHFVHKNPHNQQLVVLANFFTVTNNDSDRDGPWEKYARIASELKKPHQTVEATFNLSRLMANNHDIFYRYTGSLTSPPCTEGVLWTIFPYELSIKEESLDRLRKNLLKNTYRPVQALNGRTVFRQHPSSKTI